MVLLAAIPGEYSEVVIISIERVKVKDIKRMVLKTTYL